MQTTKDGTKKYGSAYAAKRYDSYHAGDQPEVESTPVHHGEEHDEKMAQAKAGDASGVEAPTATVESHGPAHTVVYQHGKDEHTVTSHHDDGHQTESKHTSAADAYGHGEALAYEAGGEEQATSPKKREHPSQQGAESEEKNYEEFDTE